MQFLFFSTSSDISLLFSHCATNKRNLSRLVPRETPLSNHTRDNHRHMFFGWVFKKLRLGMTTAVLFLYFNRMSYNDAYWREAIRWNRVMMVVRSDRRLKKFNLEYQYQIPSSNTRANMIFSIKRWHTSSYNQPLKFPLFLI